jgi:hypothetical protein
MAPMATNNPQAGDGPVSARDLVLRIRDQTFAGSSRDGMLPVLFLRQSAPQALCEAKSARALGLGSTGAAHKNMSKQALNPEKVREGLKHVRLRPAK